MISWSALFVFSPLLLTGCAAYEVQPLMIQHPAHPKAMAAPELPRSVTLAYTPSDIPSPQPASDSYAASREESPQTVVGDGKVIAVVTNTSQIVVEHGEIKGFMDAMTMGYKVDPPSLLERLKPGDEIRFTIDIQKKAIVKIEGLKK